MQETLFEEKMSKIASLNGVNVYQIKAEKFKTNTINVFFHDNLSRENAAKNALLPAVLRRGCESLPTFQDISQYLEELYGAGFDCGVVKKGERQIIQFYIEYVSEKYTGETDNIFKKVFGLLYEIITKPVLENSTFKKEYMDQEKVNLKKLIESRVNDKLQYAVERCFEKMCEDEPYGIYEYGSVNDLESINGQNLYEHYKYFLKSLPMDVFITGKIDEDNLNWLIDELFQLERGNIKDVDISLVAKEVKEVKDITEKMSVSQGKLSLGFRTNTASNDKDYYTLLVYNGILGGGMHSKLFQNVREKASLAYYAFSRLEKFKGLMIISSGIELDNKDKAIDIILQQMDDIKAGNISDYEFDSTVKTIETGIKSLKDSQLQVVDFYLSQAIVNTNDTLDGIIEKVKSVSKKDVVAVAKKIRLDTIYFLTAGEKEQAE
ncbi:MAG: insulinase family protein [Clostridia bacterium]|nr:insulinase family protein [Clostridia bacterium]